MNKPKVGDRMKVHEVPSGTFFIPDSLGLFYRNSSNSNVAVSDGDFGVDSFNEEKDPKHNDFGWSRYNMCTIVEKHVWVPESMQPTYGHTPIVSKCSEALYRARCIAEILTPIWELQMGEESSLEVTEDFEDEYTISYYADHETCPECRITSKKDPDKWFVVHRGGEFCILTNMTGVEL